MIEKTTEFNSWIIYDINVITFCINELLKANTFIDKQGKKSKKIFGGFNMNLFSLFSNQDINKGVDKFRNTSGSVLLDVRTKKEYNQGNIEGSINIPLDRLEVVQEAIKNKKTPLFVYCHSGARSTQAVDYLKRIGYTNVENIGGYMNYKEKVVR